jgi:hypothetical protein
MEASVLYFLELGYDNLIARKMKSSETRAKVGV